MLLRGLRLLRGYVRFTVRGKVPERFLNITARHGIRLWDTRRTDEGFTACMYRCDYRRIRSLSKRSGVRLRIVSKHGVPLWMTRYRQRTGLVLGGCAFVVTVFVMSLFVWSIEITGLDTISESQMRAYLREQGMTVGAFLPSVDAVQLADEVMIAHPEIGWMAVNLSGSCASVEVKEKAPAPEVPDVTAPCNVKATADGVITGIETAQGKTEVMTGSAVIKGQLLVSGVMENQDGSVRLVHANAKVYARTVREASFSIPAAMTLSQPTGETARRCSLDLCGLRLPVWLSGVGAPYAILHEDEQAPDPLGVQLPVGLCTERVFAMEPREKSFDKISAKELLKRRSALYELFTLRDCTVESRDTELVRSAGAYTLRVQYTCIENIAAQEEIGVE